MASGDLRLTNITKSFGATEVLKDLSLYIPAGSFVTLLGPSGCGKTTTLRVIAGLEETRGGSVVVGGRDITNAPPEKRPVNTVFQNYALFPHMNVFKNIAYGPGLSREKSKEKPDKRTIAARVNAMLELVEMTGFDKRMPDQLSGGQRQRIAIARALINNPQILLLDEPLGALDLRLRKIMQTELKRIQRKTGVTFIYVTHDQEEALSMSDLIAVMNGGRIEQFDKPDIIYRRPKSRFCAEFVGERNNFGGTYVLTDRTIISGEPFDGYRCKGVVESVAISGSVANIAATTEDGIRCAAVEYNSAPDFESGEAVYIGWGGEDGVYLCE